MASHDPAHALILFRLKVYEQVRITRTHAWHQGLVAVLTRFPLQSVAKLYARLTDGRLVEYLSERLRTEDLSPTMRGTSRCPLARWCRSGVRQC